MIAKSQRIQHVETYYFAKKLKEISDMNKDNKPLVINLGIGSPDLLPPSIAIEELQASATHTQANSYQPYAGIETFTLAYRNWYHEKFSVLLSKDELLPLMGSKEGIMHISMAFINPGDEVLVPNPGYPSYESATKLAGGIPKFYSLEESLSWLPDLSKIESQDLSKVKIMWVNYPNMPTGAVATYDFFERLIEFAQRHNILICHDNAYSLIMNENPLSILQIKNAKYHALELTSLSKNYNMAGWRIGAVSGCKDLIDAVLVFKSNMDSGMYKPLQMAAAKALSVDSEWHNDQNEIYRQRKHKAIELMQNLDCVVSGSEAGMFVWARIPSIFKNSEQLSDDLLYNKRIFITPGTIFGSLGNQFIRISLCSPVSVFEESLHRLKNKSWM